jgi:hypothetical protein
MRFCFFHSLRQHMSRMASCRIFRTVAFITLTLHAAHGAPENLYGSLDLTPPSTRPLFAGGLKEYQGPRVHLSRKGIGHIIGVGSRRAFFPIGVLSLRGGLDQNVNIEMGEEETLQSLQKEVHSSEIRKMAWKCDTYVCGHSAWPQ